MGKLLLKISKKITALGLVLILLFNISSEAFAALTLPQNEELAQEIKSVLQETFAAQETSNYKECVNNNSVSACQNYLRDLKAQFSKSVTNAQKNNTTIESKKSYKEYEKEYKQAIEKEYQRATEEIEKEIRQALWYSDLSFDTANHLNYLEKQSKEELKAWKETEEKNIKSSYVKYEKDYQTWQAKEAKLQEEAGKKYLKAEAKKIIAAYEATDNVKVKRFARELLVVLLNSEEKPGEIIEERAKVEQILLAALENRPCATTMGGKTLTKEGADKYIGYDKPGVYPSLTREDWNIIEAGYKDVEACQNAFIALEGLGYLQGTSQAVSKVEKFIEENSKDIAAGDSLINGSAVLLKWKSYQTLKKYIAKQFSQEKNNEGKGVGGFGGISEKVAYNGNYLGNVSIWTQREDGSNAWEDLADLLASEGSAQSKEILKSAVSSCKVVKEVLGKDKLECQTIMPFLYGALLHAPKVMNEAKPYQEPIPQYKEYLDAQGKARQVTQSEIDGIKRRNAYIEKTFNEKIKSYGANISSGLAGFLYNLKFNDMPVDKKMALDNKLAKVYSNIAPYTKGSARYTKLKTNRAVVSIFKYVGIAIDVVLTFTLVGDIAKGALGASALVRAKNLLKGKNALSIAQRANILRQVAFIREGFKLRRFGRNFTAGIVNSANIGRKINASAYLAQKNGMNPINYMLHNIAYQRGKNIVLRNNILRVEGSRNFFNSNHYIPEVHGDIFRITRDVKRASKIGVKELGEGGQVLSYIDKAKINIFRDYTRDYIKGQEAVLGSAQASKAEVMSGQTKLLSREYLYSRKYKDILPFAQDGQFSGTFKAGDKIYEGLRKEGLYVINKETGEVYNDFRFNFDGYLNKHNLLIGRELGIRKPKNLVLSKVINSGEKANFAQNISLIKEPSSLIVPSFVNNNTTLALTVGTPFIPSISTLLSPFYALNIKNNFSWLNTKILGKDALTEYVGETFKAESLKPIPTQDNAPNHVLIETLNDMLDRLNDFATGKELTAKKLAFYDKLSKEIYALSETSEKVTWEKLNKVSEKIDILSSEKPLFVFYGYNLDNILRPQTLPEEEFFVFDLTESLDYKKDFAEKINLLSSIFDEYTIYTIIHGSKNGYLALNKDKQIYIDDIADLIDKAKGNSIVNWVSGSCHSGAGVTRKIIKSGLNILLLSGVNDTCFNSDAKYVRINDLISSYYDAVRDNRYGSILIYDGKVFNSIKDAKKVALKEESLPEKLNYLDDIFFSRKPLGINLFNFLKTFPKWEIKGDFIPTINFENSPAFPFVLASNNVFTYIAPDSDKGGAFAYMLDGDVFNSGKQIKLKYTISEEGNETNNIIARITREFLEKNFPKWKYEPNSPVNSFLSPVKLKEVYVSEPLNNSAGTLRINGNILPQLDIDYGFEGKYLKPIPTENIAPNKVYDIVILNDMLKALNEISAGKKLSAKKLNFYNNLSKEIYALANNPDRLSMSETAELYQKVDMLKAEKPLFVFHGYDFDYDDVLIPENVNPKEMFVFDLTKTFDYNKYLGEKIKLISSVFDEYTIYTLIHGSQKGYLRLNTDKKATIAGFADIIDRNKGNSVVNWVSGSCYSGAEMTPSIVKPGLNILLISGANDVCFDSDIEFVRVNDLISTYYDVVDAKRYGSVLIYDGQIFNSIKDAKKKAIGEETDELNALNEIFFNRNKLGESIFYLLKHFPKWHMSKFSLQKLKSIEGIPFVFNPKSNIFNFRTYITPPNMEDGHWIYEIEKHNDYGQIISNKQYSLIETGSKTHNLLRDITKETLEKRFPKWKYAPLSSLNTKLPIKLKDSPLETNIEPFEEEYNMALQKALENSNKIGWSPDKIRELFEVQKDSIKTTIEVIGLNALLYSYQGKIPEILNVILLSNLVKFRFSPNSYELLLQKINPKQSQKYKELTEEMNRLREKAKNDPSFREERDRITSLQRKTAKGEELLVQDALEKFKLIAGIAKNDTKVAEGLVEYIKPKTESYENIWKIKTKNAIFKQMKVSLSDDLLVKLNMDDYSNFSSLLLTKKETQENLREIFNLININKNKEVSAILENLSWNRKTRKMFTDLGINWNAWTKADPNNYVQETIRIDILQEKKEFIEEVNKYATMLLEDYEEVKFKAIGSKIKIEDGALLFEGQKVETFPQAVKVVSALRKIIVSSENQKQYASTLVSEFIETLPHMADVLSTIAKENQIIKIRLADTNNIGNMLALGGKSACCRALGSIHEEAAISLITNKMSTAFEILADDKIVGSVMVYLTAVNGDLALVLGTLETRSVYSKNEAISKAVVNFARKFAVSIDKPNIPIYMATTGQEKTMQFFANPQDMPPATAQFFNNADDSNAYNIKPLGKIGKYPIYLSYSLASKTKWDNLNTNNYLYHLNYPFEERENVKSILYNRPLSFITGYFKSLFVPSLGVVSAPLAFIMTEMKKFKATPKLWATKTAEMYLREHAFSQTDIAYVIKNCYVNGKFNSNFFDLFVKGYEIKKDVNFAMVAFNSSVVGEGVFDYQRYATIYSIAKRVPQMTYEEISSYALASQKELEALFYVADNFPTIIPFEIMNLASNRVTFKPGTLNFNNYEKIIGLLKKGFSFDTVKKIYTSCLDSNNTWDEAMFTKIDNVAKAAIKRKDIFLSAKNKQFTDKDVKEFIYGLSSEIKAAFDVCDESTLIAAMGYKMVKFENFVKAAARLRFNLDFAKSKEQFLEIFYPGKTAKVRRLENKIIKLKSKFSDTPKSELQDLKNEINTFTKQLRTLLEQEKTFSPQEKIEMINIMSNFNEAKELKDLLKTAKQVKTKGMEVWNKKIFELLSSYLGKTYNIKVEDKLHLLTSPYLMRVFKSVIGEDFNTKFQELLVLLSREDFGKSLDKLHHNIATKKDFESLGLNYEKYTNPNTALSRSFYDGNNLVEIKPVNMRDVSKSLFLGNEFSSCTAMGSFYDHYAIPYIMNTFVGAIEVVVNGKPVGNTMIYPIINENFIFDAENNYTGQFNNEIALLIDDLKIVAPYNKGKYLQEVARLAEDIAKDIGIKEGKVYISDSNIIGYDKLDMGSTAKFYLIGKNLDPIWLNATYTDAKAGFTEYVGTFVSSDKIK
ncbi:MAG: hypothetical protein IKP23_03430 [Elusimicrobiaceae bacterium]|nr:hypothetical protein [Elusimicrobiaceae bacterium]